jgi:hypothetical protein
VVTKIITRAVFASLLAAQVGFAATLDSTPVLNRGSQVRLSPIRLESNVLRLPQLWIHTGGQAIARRDRVTAIMQVIEPSTTKSSPEGKVVFTGRAGIGIRGSGSTVFPKKAYRLEVLDEDGLDKKISLLGMPPESDWILVASYTDRTLMRDVLAYELWRKMGYYAPRTRYVELFINTNALKRTNSPLTPALSSNEEERGKAARERAALSTFDTNGYQGVYILVEKIKRGKERLKIKRLKPQNDREPEITGGYIFKKDRVNAGEKGFLSSHRIEFAFEEPKERDITPAQKRWLTNFANEFEEVLFSRSFADPTNGYAKYIDVDSFVDYHWFIEATKNVDAHWFSQFFYKDRGGKLKAGPVWDWDQAFGNAGYLYGQKTNGWRWDQVKGSYYAWYDRLFEDEEFLQRYIDRWPQLRRTVFVTANILSRIDEMAVELEPAAIPNHQLWYASPIGPGTNASASAMFYKQVDRMKEWIAGRLAWIDSQGFPPPEIAVVKLPTDGDEQEEFETTLSCQAGRIFYTINDTDPRARGGAVAQGALEYRETASFANQCRAHRSRAQRLRSLERASVVQRELTKRERDDAVAEMATWTAATKQ